MCCSQGSTEQCDSPRTALPPANVLMLSRTPSTLRRTSQGSEQGGRGHSPSVGELGCTFVFFCFFPIAYCIPCTSGDGSRCSKMILGEVDGESYKSGEQKPFIPFTLLVLCSMYFAICPIILLVFIYSFGTITGPQCSLAKQ